MTEATGSWVGSRALDRRIVVVWTVQEAVGYGALALVVLAVDIGARLAGADLPGPPGLAAGLLAVVGGLAAWWLPRASYRHWRYQVAEDALELRHGVVRRIHSAIPYFRVQHIDVAQGPVERAVGLARLVVHTASAGTDATIPGIAAGAASSWPGPVTAMRSEDPGPPAAPDLHPPAGPEIPGAPGEGGGPKRLHGLSPVFFAGRHVRQLWPLALLLAARRQWWLLALGALVLLAWSTLEWLRRTYALEGGALRLEEGVLARKLRAVPFDRIQQVDLVRKPLHRLLGVATLRVETAGGGSAAEVDLDVVTLPEARALRASLLRAKASLAEAPAGQGAAGRTTGDRAGAEVAEVAEAAAPPAERVLVRLRLGEV